MRASWCHLEIWKRRGTIKILDFFYFVFHLEKLFLVLPPIPGPWILCLPSVWGNTIWDLKRFSLDILHAVLHVYILMDILLGVSNVFLINRIQCRKTYISFRVTSLSSYLPHIWLALKTTSISYAAIHYYFHANFYIGLNVKKVNILLVPFSDAMQNFWAIICSLFFETWVYGIQLAFWDVCVFEQ